MPRCQRMVKRVSRDELAARQMFLATHSQRSVLRQLVQRVAQLNGDDDMSKNRCRGLNQNSGRSGSAPLRRSTGARPKGSSSANRLMTMLAAGCTALGIAAPLPAAAGSLLTNFRSTSTAINAGALLVGGSYQFDQFGQADPWVAQLYAEVGDCFRIDVFSQDTDLEATLISPSGTVWRNDDRSGTDLRPLIKAQGTGRGWHVLQISRHNGGSPGSNFKLYYGRYPAGNPNCATPTPPLTAPPGVTAASGTSDK